jgi:NADH-quinone oxidoreductase subunit J
LTHDINIIVWALLLLSLVVSALCTVMIKNLLKAAISLAVASAVLTVVMFLLGATLAAVLELSVCAGLITAVFVSTISMTTPITGEERTAENRHWLKRVIYLPFILVAVGIGAWLMWPSMDIAVSPATPWAQVTSQLWKSPELTVFGLILIVLAGVFGVVVLFRGKAVKK